MNSFNRSLGAAANLVPTSVPYIWVELVEFPYARYYFLDETSDFVGPWLTQGETEAQLAHYVTYVLG